MVLDKLFFGYRHQYFVASRLCHSLVQLFFMATLIVAQSSS